MCGALQEVEGLDGRPLAPPAALAAAGAALWDAALLLMQRQHLAASAVLQSQQASSACELAYRAAEARALAARLGLDGGALMAQARRQLGALRRQAAVLRLHGQRLLVRAKGGGGAAGGDAPPSQLELQICVHALSSTDKFIAQVAGAP